MVQVVLNHKSIGHLSDDTLDTYLKTSWVIVIERTPTLIVLNG